MTHKLIKDVDDETWRKFIAYCKLKNITVGEELNNILDDFLKNKFNKLLKKK
ncbi:MAG TPA: hypothetical protein VJ438_05205 [Candidatus Nanoarchaeia archaeon]|nr:hypothetical protein [Candidatus Nanoarchaeia archaeon]